MTQGLVQLLDRGPEGVLRRQSLLPLGLGLQGSGFPAIFLLGRCAMSRGTVASGRPDPILVLLVLVRVGGDLFGCPPLRVLREVGLLLPVSIQRLEKAEHRSLRSPDNVPSLPDAPPLLLPLPLGGFADVHGPVRLLLRLGKERLAHGRV